MHDNLDAKYESKQSQYQYPTALLIIINIINICNLILSIAVADTQHNKERNTFVDRNDREKIWSMISNDSIDSSQTKHGVYNLNNIS